MPASWRRCSLARTTTAAFPANPVCVPPADCRSAATVLRCKARAMLVATTARKLTCRFVPHLPTLPVCSTDHPYNQNKLIELLYLSFDKPLDSPQAALLRFCPVFLREGVTQAARCTRMRYAFCRVRPCRAKHMWRWLPCANILAGSLCAS